MAVTLFTRFINLRSLVNVNNVNAIGTAVNITQRLSTTPRCHREVTEIHFDDDEGASGGKSKQKMSAAMKMYLKRSEEYHEFMKKEIAEYDIGKRHLANIMGENPETFTQADVNRSIRYLFPSGLYDRYARPMMAHPKALFPPKKAAQFDETGRPHHSLFYTTKPNYYQALYNIVGMLEELNEEEDKLLQSGKLPDAEQKVDSLTTTWLSKAEIEKRLLEPISDQEYNHLVAALDKLVNHPLSSYAQNVIKKYQRKLVSAIKDMNILPLKYTEDGKALIHIRNCRRKSARGTVTIVAGTGKIKINGKDITYFANTQSREQIIFPLIFTDMADKVDVVARVSGGGPTGQAGAIRWGIAWGLRSFVERDMIEKMRLAGLLTRDWRKRERKKYGQEGARRKFTWKKR